MAVPGTFERVYAAIKQRLRTGLYRPGDRLEPAALSEDLHASVTPVRDALHRLTGERLVESPPHEGFRVPMLTETTLRQLYSWHLDLVLLAAMKRRGNAVAAQAIAKDGVTAPAAYQLHNSLFLAVARSTGNPEHVAALGALTDRLEPMQRVEQMFLDGTDAETDEIVKALQGEDRRALRRSLVRYHRRRTRIVPQILAALHDRSD
jgi:DNA-binding GntR family transcriptional regulator